MTTKNIIDKTLLGYNGTILLYGQTGSGKTYTISNDINSQNLKGIIPRTFEYLFKKLNINKLKEENIKIDINIAYVQIYLESIQDLAEDVANGDEKIKIVKYLVTIKAKSANELETKYRKLMNFVKKNGMRLDGCGNKQ